MSTAALRRSVASATLPATAIPCPTRIEHMADVQRFITLTDAEHECEHEFTPGSALRGKATCNCWTRERIAALLAQQPLAPDGLDVVALEDLSVPIAVGRDSSREQETARELAGEMHAWYMAHPQAGIGETAKHFQVGEQRVRSLFVAHDLPRKDRGWHTDESKRAVKRIFAREPEVELLGDTELLALDDQEDDDVTTTSLNGSAPSGAATYENVPERVTNMHRFYLSADDVTLGHVGERFGGITASRVGSLFKEHDLYTRPRGGVRRPACDPAEPVEDETPAAEAIRAEAGGGGDDLEDTPKVETPVPSYRQTAAELVQQLEVEIAFHEAEADRLAARHKAEALRLRDKLAEVEELAAA